MILLEENETEKNISKRQDNFFPSYLGSRCQLEENQNKKEKREPRNIALIKEGKEESTPWRTLVQGKQGNLPFE